MPTTDREEQKVKETHKGLRNRFAISYAIEGDLRFISHQDSLRLFRRALARAGIGVRYSEGFNPKPRIRIALPRPVGVASREDVLVLELTSDLEPSNLLNRLSTQIPAGVRLLAAERLADRDRRLPCEVKYALPLEPAARESVAQAVADFLSKDKVIVQRASFKTPSKKVMDIRCFVLVMEVLDGSLTWTQAMGPEGTAGIGEVLQSVGLSSDEHLHRVVRVEVSYGE